MPFFRLTRQTFIGDRLRDAGTVVEHDGPADGNLRPSTRAEFDAQRAAWGSDTPPAPLQLPADEIGAQ